MIFFYVLLALALLRLIAVLAFSAFLIGSVAACPACFADSIRIQKTWLQRVAPWVEWRWCPHCGWQGPARRQG